MLAAGLQRLYRHAGAQRRMTWQRVQDFLCPARTTIHVCRHGTHKRINKSKNRRRKCKDMITLHLL
jgi:hypothetical protein